MATNGTDKFQVWEERWRALNRAMDETQKLYQVIPVARFPRKGTICDLFRRLQSFACGQFDYFFSGFKNNTLARSDAFPPEHVLAVILDQVGYDLDVIERVAAQRLTGTQREIETLMDTDKLAWLALKPAIGTMLGEDTSVLTYFRKSPNIRVVPYAHIAIIGVPYSCTTTPIDLLAIPHEVGHYVFWHRDRGQAGAFRNSIVADKNPVSAWREEIFADVYGCLVAGPVIAFDFQELAKQYSRDDFVSLNDGEHPTPFLRPQIYHKVLKRRGDDGNQWAAKAENLEKRWKIERGERTKNVGVSHVKVGRDQIPVDDVVQAGALLNAAKPVDYIVSQALAELQGVQSDWSGDVADQDVAKLGEEFTMRYHDLLQRVDALPPDPDPSADVTNVWNDWKKRLSDLPRSITTQTSEEPEWKPVFAAAGWTTEGPEDEPAQG
ncbi:MAG: hypothetical protein HY868_08615 [Chloroflexi bacterium]|nr:hypothetical protein [Chloroflexota bacterium]